MAKKKKRLTPEEQQKEAMLLYKAKLQTHKTKIVPSAPKTEIEKPLSVKANKRTKQTMQIVSLENEEEKRNDDVRLCIQCRINPAWLNHMVCYECYLKKTNEAKEKKHWAGGMLNLESLSTYYGAEENDFHVPAKKNVSVTKKSGRKTRSKKRRSQR